MPVILLHVCSNRFLVKHKEELGGLQTKALQAAFPAKFKKGTKVVTVSQDCMTLEVGLLDS